MTRCTNAEPGTFNHECGKPATWAGRHPSGHVQYFCEDCALRGAEARAVSSWDRIFVQAGCDQFKTELTPAGEQTVIPGCERNASPKAVQLGLFG